MEKTKQRFWSKVEKTEYCWLWKGWTQGRTDKTQYGYFRIKNKNISAHRLAYSWEVGRLKDGMEIDHMCYNPLCVRPDHLQQITRAENHARRRPYVIVDPLKFVDPSQKEDIVTFFDEMNEEWGSIENSTYKPRSAESKIKREFK